MNQLYLPEDRERSLKRVTLLVYGLQAASFLLVITSIAAIIINYLKLDDVRGTWLESHFRWQMRTFWYALLWIVIGTLTSFILIGYLVLMVNFIWVIYRIARGMLALFDRRPLD
jgi:uncharacterized membrane protein